MAQDHIRVLNVAGSRISKEREIAGLVAAVLDGALAMAAGFFDCCKKLVNIVAA